MGAVTFDCVAEGVDVKQAFKNAKEDASLYSSPDCIAPILKKTNFLLCSQSIVDRDIAYKIADDILDGAISTYSSISNKYGPAGCIQITSNQFIFFGWVAD